MARIIALSSLIESQNPSEVLRLRNARCLAMCALRPFSPGQMVTHQTFSWTPLTPFSPAVLLFSLDAFIFFFSLSIYNKRKKTERERESEKIVPRRTEGECKGSCGGSCDEYCRGRLLFPLTNHPPMSRGVRAAMFYSSLVSGRHEQHPRGKEREREEEEENSRISSCFILISSYQEVTIVRYPYFSSRSSCVDSKTHCLHFFF